MNKMILVTAAAFMLAAGLATAGDAKIKAMIVGTWRSECNCDGSSKPDVYKSDGTVVIQLNGTDIVEKWWVKDGALLETDHSSDRTDYFKILLLTERVLVLQGMTVHSKGYFLYWRKDEDL